MVEFAAFKPLGGAVVVSVQPDQAQRLIDDELPDIERGDRQQGADDPDGDGPQRECRARRPDLAEEWPQIAQRSQPVTQALSGDRGRTFRCEGISS